MAAKRTTKVDSSIRSAILRTIAEEIAQTGDGTGFGSRKHGSLAKDALPEPLETVIDVSSRRLASVVVKVAGLCNLNCHYCYIYNHEDDSWRSAPRFMSKDVFQATLGAIKSYCSRRGDHAMHIAMHGGEPLLIGHAKFGEMCGQASSFLGPMLSGISVQTNATLIDRAWAAVFVDHNLHVGLSLDGPARVHDDARVDHAGKGSYTRVIDGLQTLQEAGIEPTILCVVDPAADGLEIYQHFLGLGARTINFLLPEVSHDNRNALYGDSARSPVADYLIPVFDAWYDGDDPGIRIHLFWGLLRMLMGTTGMTDAFGNTTINYLVVETDGSIQPLGSLRVCENGITEMGLNVLRHSLDDLALGNPLLHQLVHHGMPLPAACSGCPEERICGGGYLPNRFSKARRFDNRSVWCADILRLLSHIRTRALLPAAALDHAGN